MNRTEKSMKNIAFGIGSQAVLTLLHFFTKSVIARLLGAQIVSMNGLFHEVLNCLSLAELGIGSAIVYNLYKPLAENDHEKVSQLMTFFKKAYRIIAAFIMVVGFLFSFFVQYIVKDITYPLWFIRIIFNLFVISSASSYLFSYKITLLNADQNVFIFSIYNTIFTVVRTGINIAMLFIFNRYGDEYSYIWYLSISIFTNLAANYYISTRVDRLYPYLTNIDLDKEGQKKVFDNVKNIFIKELSGKLTNSTDNILISILVSTIMVAPNQFYTTLTGVFKNVVNQVETGIRASLGNLFAVGNTNECMRVINRLTWGYAMISVWGCTGLFVCSVPFISMWVGAEYLYDEVIVLSIVINMYLYIISRPIYAAMHLAGYFREGRNISIAGSVVNLFVSIVLGKLWGILGIFLGTSCTYIIQIVLKIYYVHKLKFKTSSLKYSLSMLAYSIMTLANMYLCKYICSFLPFKSNIILFIFSGIIVSVIIFCEIFIVYHRSEEYKYFKNLIAEKLIRKLKILRN